MTDAKELLTHVLRAKEYPRVDLLLAFLANLSLFEDGQQVILRTRGICMPTGGGGLKWERILTASVMRMMLC